MTRVRVEQGWLEGETLDLCTGDGQYYSFKGIPYAAPPVGKLRFKAPQPPLPWDGVRKANKHGSVCGQLDIFTRQLMLGSEDCLFLNVYTKHLNPTSPLAVMVFIHGGGFKSGSGDETFYGPDFLVNHDVVLVTINYRLEAFGFLCLDTKDVPGNAGLKDQVAALKWVKENIDKFGGDPNNVTIFGESAGGASVAYHTLSPMSKGLFNRAIPMSGVPFCDWATPFEPRRRAFELGKKLGFKTDDPDKLLEFLQSVPHEKLINQEPLILYSEKVVNNILKMYCFTPVAEIDFGQEIFMSKDPLTALKKKQANEVDLLIGFTSKECLIGIDLMENSMCEEFDSYKELLAPTKMIINCTPAQVLKASDAIHEHYFNKEPLKAETNMKEFVEYSSDVGFVYDVLRFANYFPKRGDKKKFFYLFSCVSDRNIYGLGRLKYELDGASHLDDTAYLFDPKHANLKLNGEGYEMVKLICTVFTNFAKYGTPTPDGSLGVMWPEYDDQDQGYVDIGHKLTQGNKLKQDVYNFWKRLYESVGQPF